MRDPTRDELPVAAHVETIVTAQALRHLDGIFSDVDLLLTSNAVGERPGSTGDPSFNSIWTPAWIPCVTPAAPARRGYRSASNLLGYRMAALGQIGRVLPAGLRRLFYTNLS